MSKKHIVASKSYQNSYELQDIYSALPIRVKTAQSLGLGYFSIVVDIQF